MVAFTTNLFRMPQSHTFQVMVMLVRKYIQMRVKWQDIKGHAVETDFISVMFVAKYLQASPVLRKS